METLLLTKKVDISTEKKQDKVNFFNLCVFIFVLGCIIGYVVEVIYAYYKHGRFINKQGMIYGPFNQIYGFGAMIFTLSLYKFRKSNKLIILIAGTIVGGLFEYVCSYLQEIIFKSESWNYSKFPLSFNGRTNPIHALFWGVLGVLFMTFILPPMIHMINNIPIHIATIISWLLFVFMIINMTISAAAVCRQAERKKGEKPSNSIECFLDKHYDDDFLKKVYPNMKFIK